MALTEAEIVNLFQLLGVPMRTGVDVDESFSDTKQTYSQDAYNTIMGWCSSLTTAQEAEVKAILAKYSPIKYNVVDVKTNSVSVSYDKQRSILRSAMLVLMPISLVELGSDQLVVG